MAADISDQLYAAAQAAASDDEDLNGGMLMGLHVVAEWAGQDETTYLTWHSRGVDGLPLTDWRAMGYLEWAKQALIGMESAWSEDEDE
jgi:hypothetical protein